MTNQSTFFQQLSEIEFTGNLQLTIAKDDKGNLVVSVLVKNDQCTDPAKFKITPLVLTGPPPLFDSGFIELITKPVQNASDLMNNMEQFKKDQEKAKIASEMEKKKKEEEKKQAESLQKKVEKKKEKDSKSGLTDLFAAPGEQLADEEESTDEEE